MKITGKRVLTNLERFILMTLGVVLTAIGVYFFKFPNNFTTGGVSGISLILSRILVDPLLTPGMVMLLINVALLIVGYLFLGRGFALSTVYCSMLLSVLTAESVIVRCRILGKDSVSVGEVEHYYVSFSYLAKSLEPLVLSLNEGGV